MTEAWHNWSGSVVAEPARIARPRSEDELAELVRAAELVRVVGAGHSFMPLCATPGTLIDLAALDSPIELADDERSAWAPGGWSLARVTEGLWRIGFALPNQGDINAQSLAGATATGTHGTGEALGCLSTFVRGVRVMLADGSVVECSAEREPALFEAMRLSLGLIGIATRIRIDVMPAYQLEERLVRMRLGEVIERFAELARQHRHAEFFVFPYADEALVKTLDIITGAVPEDDLYRPPRGDPERAFRRLCEASHAMPFAISALQRLGMKTVRAARVVGPAHQIFPSTRTVRFEEMEYELPRNAGFAALRELIRWIRARKLPVIFPFEFRWTAGDDIWLSPFNRGPCASVSMHQYSKRPWEPVFRDAEPVFRAHAGRPHWAKRHTLSARDVFALYPRAREFCAVRRRVDPARKFANDPMTALFDLENA